MAEHASKPVLEREVLAPQSPYSGLGVVMVAALAMFLAMASSAFVVRARMAKPSCPSYRTVYQSQLPAAQDWNTGERMTPQECGKPVYHINPGGSISVLYRTCPEDGLDRNGLDRLAAPPVAIEVRSVR
jgi:hypothetical protein